MRGGDPFRSACAVQRHELQQPPEHGVAKGQGRVWMRSAKELAHAVDSREIQLWLMNVISGMLRMRCSDGERARGSRLSPTISSVVGAAR